MGEITTRHEPEPKRAEIARYASRAQCREISRAFPSHYFHSPHLQRNTNLVNLSLHSLRSTSCFGGGLEARAVMRSVQRAQRTHIASLSVGAPPPPLSYAGGDQFGVIMDYPPLPPPSPPLLSLSTGSGGKGNGNHSQPTVCFLLAALLPSSLTRARGGNSIVQCCCCRPLQQCCNLHLNIKFIYSMIKTPPPCAGPPFFAGIIFFSLACLLACFVVIAASPEGDRLVFFSLLSLFLSFFRFLDTRYRQGNMIAPRFVSWRVRWWSPFDGGHRRPTWRHTHWIAGGRFGQFSGPTNQPNTLRHSKKALAFPCTVSLSKSLPALVLIRAEGYLLPPPSTPPPRVFGMGIVNIGVFQQHQPTLPLPLTCCIDFIIIWLQISVHGTVHRIHMSLL